MRHITMRNIIFVVLLIFLLVAGCGGPGAGANKEKPKTYSGFMDWKAGMWTETTARESGSTLKIRTELLENSPSEARFQVTTEKGGKSTVAQLWYDAEAKKITKYVIKNDDGLECADPADAPKKRIPATGENYPVSAAPTPLVKYTTSSGKEVFAAKFATTDGETLVSSDVPFGIVSIVQNGKATVVVDDFGTIGARTAFSDDDLPSCGDEQQVAAAEDEPVEAPAEELAQDETQDEETAESPAE